MSFSTCKYFKHALAL